MNLKGHCVVKICLYLHELEFHFDLKQLQLGRIWSHQQTNLFLLFALGVQFCLREFHVFRFEFLSKGGKKEEAVSVLKIGFKFVFAWICHDPNIRQRFGT